MWRDRVCGFFTANCFSQPLPLKRNAFHPIERRIPFTIQQTIATITLLNSYTASTPNDGNITMFLLILKAFIDLEITAKVNEASETHMTLTERRTTKKFAREKKLKMIFPPCSVFISSKQTQFFHMHRSLLAKRKRQKWPIGVVSEEKPCNKKTTGKHRNVDKIKMDDDGLTVAG